MYELHLPTHYSQIEDDNNDLASLYIRTEDADEALDPFLED